MEARVSQGADFRYVSGNTVSVKGVVRAEFAVIVKNFVQQFVDSQERVEIEGRN